MLFLMLLIGHKTDDSVNLDKTTLRIIMQPLLAFLYESIFLKQNNILKSIVNP